MSESPRSTEPTANAASVTDEAVRRVRGAGLRLLAGSWIAMAIAVLAVVHLFACLGIAYAQWPESHGARSILVAGYAFGLVFLLIRGRSRWKRVAASSLLAPLAVWMLYDRIEPKRDGRYPPETSRASTVEFAGDRFTIRDVRNFDYRSESDFDVRFEDRSYDLRTVSTVDYVVCWWTTDRQIAHTMLSFGFDDGRYLCCSIEIRREIDESYGPIEGLFRRYELIYVWGDERDLIRLRTNHRGEDVCLYRTTCSRAEARSLLEDYLVTTRALAEKPAFYNTLQRNCTTSIRDHIDRVLPRKIPWYARRLRNGFTDRRAWEGGWLAGTGDFEAIQAEARIVERARAAERDPAFSRLIRTHIP